jgi:hypothetical protein
MKYNTCLILSRKRDCITQPMDNLRALCESMLMLKGISPPDTDNLIAKFTNLEEVRDFAEIKCESISHTVCRKVKVRIKVLKIIRHTKSA